MLFNQIIKKLFLISIGFLVLSFSLVQAQTVLININTASLTELKMITGVGDSIAKKIIDYRTANGPFVTIEDLKNVSGIGDVNFLKMKGSISVSGPSSAGGSSGSSSGTSSGNNDSGNSSNFNLTNNTDAYSFGEEGGESGGDDIDSAHTSQSPLSLYQKNLPALGVGRDRLATVRTPIKFVAYEAGLLPKGGSVDFVWSFGDGTSGRGREVSHAFIFSGQYNVVLNASFGDGVEAVSRTKVVVLDSQIRLGQKNSGAGFVEIINAGEREQNINAWSLVRGDKKYVFPLDTIISAKSSIKIPTTWLGEGEGAITLFYPDGAIASTEGAALNLSSEQKIKLATLQKEVRALRQELVSRQNFATVAQAPLPNLASQKAQNVLVLKKDKSFLAKIKDVLFK